MNKALAKLKSEAARAGRWDDVMRLANNREYAAARLRAGRKTKKNPATKGRFAIQELLSPKAGLWRTVQRVGNKKTAFARARRIARANPKITFRVAS